MQLERLLVGGAIGTPVILAAAWLAGLRVNLTESIPRGIYRVVRDGDGAQRVRRGETVLVCLPAAVAAFARARGYVPGGGSCVGGAMPVGKVVLAAAGDTVVITETGLMVDGRQAAESAPLARDRAGRPLPRLAYGSYVMHVGEVWLGSRSARGFDSRYFGAVPASGLRRRLTPVWIVAADGDESHGPRAPKWKPPRRAYSDAH